VVTPEETYCIVNAITVVLGWGESFLMSCFGLKKKNTKNFKLNQAVTFETQLTAAKMILS